MGPVISGLAERSEVLLQGRITYQVSAAAWSERGGDHFADWINSAQKYVVSDSHSEADLEWSPTSIVRVADPTRTVSELRNASGGDIYVYGSSLTLVRSLLARSSSMS
jgi:dihydrofolate reductase